MTLRHARSLLAAAVATALLLWAPAVVIGFELSWLESISVVLTFGFAAFRVWRSRHL